MLCDKMIEYLIIDIHPPDVITDIKFLNAFNRIIPGGVQTFEKLKNHFGDFEKAWSVNSHSLLCLGLSKEISARIIAEREKMDPDKEWEKLENENIRILSREDDDYPDILREVPQPPFALYVRGALPSKTDVAISIVGSRKYTAYGKQACEKIVTGLAGYGITVISGLALGIDAIAHKSALDAGGKTIAILGTGIDDKSIYPAQNFQLAKEIIKNNGALISEFAPGTPALPYHFPMRNRIISGLSKGVVIIEASEKSGSLITANLALEQNKDVFAVPGPIHSESSKGTNHLIKQGAKLTTSADDILEEIAPQILNDQTSKIQGVMRLPDLSEEENNLLKILSNGEEELDQILKTANIPANRFNSILTMLEIKGIIKNQNGKIYKI